MFIDFANFYKRFIKRFSRIIFDLTDLLKDAKKSKFQFTEKAKISFNDLKKTFTTTFTLIHFDFIRKILLKTNVSEFVSSEILSQLIKKTNQ